MIASSSVFGLCGAVLIGVGLYGFITHAHLLRRLLAFNVIGSGIFLLFGATAARLPSAMTDPVPQALIITGIVVALAATALGVGLVLAYARATGRTTLPEDTAPVEPEQPPR
ncbi:MAG: NADH-quinone oxidoreductase subunit K [Blastomonas sp.]|jgi:multicomponent Na+:H+ antiporter subunit C